MGYSFTNIIATQNKIISRPLRRKFTVAVHQSLSENRISYPSGQLCANVVPGLQCIYCQETPLNVALAALMASLCNSQDQHCFYRNSSQNGISRLSLPKRLHTQYGQHKSNVREAGDLNNHPHSCHPAEQQHGSAREYTSYFSRIKGHDLALFSIPFRPMSSNNGYSRVLGGQVP